jgi:hypothetical protein
MTTGVEQMILDKIGENGKKVDCLDKKLDALALSVEHRVTTLEVEARVEARQKGGRAGAITGGAIALLTAVVGFFAALAKGLI